MQPRWGRAPGASAGPEAVGGIEGAIVHTSRWYHLAWALAGFVALQPSLSLAQGRIGGATAVTNQVQGILHGAARQLAVGSDVHSNEVVRTEDASVAQLVFLDNTNLGVGPRSSVTLDRFVYDPSRNTGRVVVRASQGIFRFVTGSQPSRDYTIETPVATIGVRGTAFDLLVRANRIVIILISGQVIVTPHHGRVVSLTQPGTQLTVFSDGRVVGPEAWPGPITDTASNAPFPYFGGVPTAMLSGPFMPSGPFVMNGLQPFLAVEGGIRVSRTTFDVTPPFDVDALTGVVGVNGGLMFTPMGGNLFFGPRVGVLFGIGSGSTESPPASPAFTYKVEMPWTVFYEAEAGTWVGNAMLHASIGGATTRTSVTGTAGAFIVNDQSTRTGVTASAGLDFAVAPSVLVGGQFRYIAVPSGVVSIPGVVPIASDVFVGTVGATWKFSDVRLKRDIVPLARLDNGIRLYQYRYLWSDELYVGVMAQEVREIVPQAVMRGTDGYLRVDYARLGLRLMTFAEWTQSARRPSLLSN
jgi:hypothetical protein